jgi:hypothetical protein
LLIHQLSSEIEEKNKNLENTKRLTEDLQLQLNTEREVSQRFQLQYEKEASRGKIAAEEFFSNIKDLQITIQHYKQKSRSIKSHYQDQIVKLKKQLELTNTQFKAYFEKSSAEKTELTERISQFKSPVSSEERSQQILR